MAMAAEDDGANQVMWDPPTFHFGPEKPTPEEGFCIFGTWALTELGVAVLTVTEAPSCYVWEDGAPRQRRDDEIPNRHGTAGIDSDALSKIRLIALREGIWRGFESIRDQARDDLDFELIESPGLRALLEGIVEVPGVERPRGRGRPENVNEKVQRAQEVIMEYKYRVAGSRGKLAKKWAQKGKSMSHSGVSSQITRLLKQDWLIASTDSFQRYAAGPRLIAEQKEGPMARPAIDTNTHDDGNNE